jgi:CheY-like chemotaxis protein
MDQAPKKILAVEDDQFIRKMLVDKTNKEGYIGIGAEDGQKGLETALKEHPDLIILDILMPVMDGIEMLKKLREDEWGKGAKVIVMTNLTRDDKLAEAYDYGVSDYLVKANWDLDDVVEKMKSVLDES